ncbi:hypothetical protein EC973_005589 [Apophysomyces ossiformis]|uniref:RNB domain-containing protein n=1 Tax=Apophysomyces ossiformis TaxID=679940 RepID=A0A8H7BWS3_9FUNG|nr:hypothetical protein EC973_005589 [Apophysomyces ossiformis]
MGISSVPTSCIKQSELRKSSVVQNPQDDGFGDAEQGQTKHPRRRRRGSRRKSSCATTEIHAATDRSQASNDGSAALQSLQDIIAEMKRLPTNSVRRASNSGEELFRGWDATHLRNRRHSEPPQHIIPLHEKEQKNDSDENKGNEPMETSDIYLHLPQDHISRRLSLEGALSEKMAVPPTLGNQNTNSKRLARRYSVPANHIRQSHSADLAPLTQPTTSQRKPLYPSHLSVQEANKLLRSCKAFSGVLQVDKQDSSDAFVSCEELGEIYIYGSRNRNRALDGDTVAVELVDVDEMLTEKINKKQARSTTRRSSVAFLSTSNPPLSSIPEDSAPMKRPAYCGKVICILDRPRHALFSGTLSLFRPNAHRENDNSKENKHNHPKIIWFIPADKRLPLVAVPLKHAPSGFVKYHEEFKHRIFVGNIQRWPASSLHPFGTIEYEIGYMGELSVHSRALLADHHLKETDFSDHVVRSAASVSDHGEYKLRLQQPHPLVFAVGESDADALAIDLEHAFSIQTVEKGDVYELGIHVADIAYYVHLNTHIDREARERAAAVTLVEKTIPMLPSSFAKTRGLTVGQDSTDPTFKTLLAVCRLLQVHRTNDGGLVLMNPSQHFLLGESGYPESLTHTDYADSDVNVLLQEPLILANKEVGQKICSKFPEHALLCRQEAPKASHLESLRDYFDTGKDMHGLVKLANQIVEDDKREAIRFLLQKMLPPAKYFCAGSLDIAKYRHFSSGASLFTIFTEPLHNYASIVVQRQLDAALKGDSLHMSNDTVDKIARQCNAKQAAKQAASQSSIHLYTTAHVYRQGLNTSAAVTQQAIVTCIKPKALELYLPEYHLELSVPMPSMATTEHGVELISKTPTHDTVVVTEKDDLTLQIDTQKEERKQQEARQKVTFLSRIDVLVTADIKTSRPALEIELHV